MLSSESSDTTSSILSDVGSEIKIIILLKIVSNNNEYISIYVITQLCEALYKTRYTSRNLMFSVSALKIK